MNEPADKIPHWDPADVIALKALSTGTANEEQQKRALEWIVENACALRENHYRANDRDTAFMLGRLHVARQIARLVEMPHDMINQVREADRAKERKDVYGTRRNRPRRDGS